VLGGKPNQTGSKPQIGLVVARDTPGSVDGEATCGAPLRQFPLAALLGAVEEALDVVPAGRIHVAPEDIVG